MERLNKDSRAAPILYKNMCLDAMLIAFLRRDFNETQEKSAAGVLAQFPHFVHIVVDIVVYTIADFIVVVIVGIIADIIVDILEDIIEDIISLIAELLCCLLCLLGQKKQPSLLRRRN